MPKFAQSMTLATCFHLNLAPLSTTLNNWKTLLQNQREHSESLVTCTKNIAIPG